MRLWLRSWLGIDEYDVNYEIGKNAQDLQFQNARLEDLYSRMPKLVDDIMALERKVNALEQELASYRMTPITKLIQLKGGLDTLTKFANELMREIER